MLNSLYMAPKLMCIVDLAGTTNNAYVFVC